MSLLENKYIVASEADLTKSTQSLDEDMDDSVNIRASQERLTDINRKINKASEKIKKYEKTAPSSVDHQHQVRMNIGKAVLGGKEDVTAIDTKLDRADKVLAHSKGSGAASMRSPPIRSTVLGFGSTPDLSTDEMDQKMDRADRVIQTSAVKGTAKHDKTVKSTVVSGILAPNANPVVSNADEHWKKANKIAEKTGFAESPEQHNRRTIRQEVIKK